MKQTIPGLNSKPASQVDYRDCPMVKMFWDSRSVAAADKFRCLITGVEVTTEKSLFSVSDGKLVVADDEWKTILYSGVAAAAGINDFGLFMSGVFGALGSTGGYMKVGDSVDTFDLSDQYGPGVSMRAGGSGVVLDSTNYINGTAGLTVPTPFTGAAGQLIKQADDAAYKVFRGTTNTSGTETTTGNGAGSLSAIPWRAFSPYITYGSGNEGGSGPVKNWSHGVAVPKNSVIDFAGIVVFEDGPPTDDEFDEAIEYIAGMRLLPPWWR